MPKPPQLVYRTPTAICVRPRPFTPSATGIGPGGIALRPTVATMAVFAKDAGVGVAVSLNNTELPGTGMKRAFGEGLDA